MENSYEQGFAFILEAATELAFYDILLNFLAERHPECKLEKRTSDEIYEPFYVVQGPFGTRVIRMNAVGTITQIKNSVHWFQNTCIHAKGKKIPWTVFLCYDTDSYNADITKFYEDDWKNFRKEISKGSRTVKIIDLAASAEIEDVFLLDLHGISQFLGLEEDLKPEDVPNGHKGSARLKQLAILKPEFGKINSWVRPPCSSFGTVSLHHGKQSTQFAVCSTASRVICWSMCRMKCRTLKRLRLSMSWTTAAVSILQAPRKNL